MSSPSKRKGTAWERAVADHLNTRGPFRRKVERSPLWGAADQGDLLNTGQFTFECKALKVIDLASGVTEAEREAVNAGTRWGVLVNKRRNHPTGKAYVTMTLDAFIDLIGELPDEHL